ncbi:hypothetical protein [Microbispora sp. NPDC049125]|uniref:hypothetical protein n=1 Tax=Microbispora sp. NPDC049125 TaxID=3154929 RepID=UPI003467321C
MRSLGKIPAVPGPDAGAGAGVQRDLGLLTTSDSDQVSPADVDFARQLAREAASFARSVERRFHGLANGRGVA